MSKLALVIGVRRGCGAGGAYHWHACSREESAELFEAERMASQLAEFQGGGGAYSGRAGPEVRVVVFLALADDVRCGREAGDASLARVREQPVDGRAFMTLPNTFDP